MDDVQQTKRQTKPGSDRERQQWLQLNGTWSEQCCDSGEHLGNDANHIKKRENAMHGDDAINEKETGSGASNMQDKFKSRYGGWR